MVQELHVLRCFSCNTFQSHIVKKTSKWECKLCGVKQSIKKVYGRGSGKDCRIHTQKLNTLKGRKEEIESSFEQAKETREPEYSVQQLTINEPSSFASPKLVSKRGKSKWAEFVDENEATVFQNNFTQQENIRSKPTESFKNNVQKRKIEDTLENEEFGGYSEDCDSVDMYYPSFNKCSSGYTKKTKFNSCRISINNTSNKIDSNNYDSQRISETPTNTRYAHFKIQNHSKPSEKSGSCLKSENNKNTSDVLLLSTKNNHQRNTKVSLKWGKYLDEIEDVITTSESECDIKWTKYIKNGKEEEKEAPCFQVDKNFEGVLSNDSAIMPPNEFRRTSDLFERESSGRFEGVLSNDDCSIMPPNEFRRTSDVFEGESSGRFEVGYPGPLVLCNEIENTTPNCNTSKESTIHCIYFSKNNTTNNYKSNFFFDLKNQEPNNTSTDETLKCKLAKEDGDNEVELPSRQKEQLHCKTVPSLPVFEQNCELSDRDFQLDF